MLEENKLPATALITGASRGIGKAIAKALSANYQVYITYVSKEAEAKQVVQEIGSDRAKAFKLNVQNSAEIVDFFNNEIKNKVDLQVLVNNAGITKDGFILRMKDEDFDSVYATNLRGAFICSREAAKIMTKNRFGRIVNITSVVGQMGNASQVNYAATKAALHAMTMSLAKELAGRNITVNSVAPGFIETDMTASLPDEVLKSYAAAIPLARLGSAEDVANAVEFLVSNKASYITGQQLAVNGGMYC